MLRPLRLKPGDTIGIAAPAGPILERSQFNKGLRRLREAGYRPRFSSGIFSRDRYLAGTERRRAQELLRLLTSPGVKGIVLARGGYGSMHLLPILLKHRHRLRPKIVMGYSDATVLLIALTEQLGWVSFHGPMLTNDISRMTSSHLRAILAPLTGESGRELWSPGLKVLRGGRATGPVLGGCLSLIVSLCGTPYQPSFRGKILFLEDTGERFYQIDRMLTQMKFAGLFAGVRGIVLGPFRRLGRAGVPFFKEVLHWFRGPIVCGFPSGHCFRPVVLPMGVPTQLDTSRRTLTLLKDCTRSSSYD